MGGTDFYVPVYATATIAVMGLLGVPTHVVPALHNRGHRLVGSGLAVAVGLITADLTLPESGLGVLLGMAVGTAAFTAIGLAVGSLLPTARAAHGLGLLSFFSLSSSPGEDHPPLYFPTGPTASSTSPRWAWSCRS